MRLFVGLDIPWDVRERLAALQRGIPGARWAPIDNYHLTLRFIGDVDAHMAEEIDHALAALRGRRFTLALGGVGTFSKGGRLTALWVGAARSQPLDLLQSKVEQTLQRAGLDPERRRFAPHVTLARLDGAVDATLAAFVQANNLFRAEIAIEHFTLFSSQLGKEASVYTAEVEYPLT